MIVVAQRRSAGGWSEIDAELPCGREGRRLTSQPKAGSDALAGFITSTQPYAEHRNPPPRLVFQEISPRHPQNYGRKFWQV